MTADYTLLIQQLHLIYLGRQAMPIERSAMAGQLAAASAPVTLDGMAEAYRSAPAVAAIIDGLASASGGFEFQYDEALAANYIVSTIYYKQFGRAADFDGLLFWTNAMSKEGLARNVAPLAIVAGALANASAQSQIDSHALVAKTAVSDIIDMFALEPAASLNWVVNSPSASSRALIYANSALPAAEYVNTALRAYGVVSELNVVSLPATNASLLAVEPAPMHKVSMDAPSVAEGSAGKVGLSFHLSLNVAPTSDLAVYYATVPGSAGKDDFQSTSGRVVFAAGQTSATITVQVTGDQFAEQSETFSLIVGGADIVGAEAIGTIVNDDLVVSLVGYHPPLLF